MGRDRDLLEAARSEAFRIAEEDPGLSRPEHDVLLGALADRRGGRLNLARVG